MSKDSKKFNAFPEITTLLEGGAFCVGQVIDGKMKFRLFPRDEFISQFDLDGADSYTREELQQIIINSGLQVGKKYIITDAIANTIQLIVVASSSSELSDFAISSDGTSYFYDINTDEGFIGIVFDKIKATPMKAPDYEEGVLWYDEDTRTFSYYDNIEGTINQICQELHIVSRNSTGAQINDGRVVYISGATSQTPNITLAQANSASTSRVIGVVTHNIANNTIGKVTTFGIVNDVDTSAFTDGALLYLSPSVAGSLTSTRPTAPNYAVLVGVCLHVHPAQGKILVNPDQRGLGFGTANQVRGMNNGATEEEYKTLTGTTNQVTITHSAGAVTFSLPQNIHTSATPVFGGMTLNGTLSIPAHRVFALRGTFGADINDGAVAVNARIDGSTGSNLFNVLSAGTIPVNGTGSIQMFRSSPATLATEYTVGTLIHFAAIQGTNGAGSVINNQYGVFIDSSLVGANFNYGVYSNIPAGSNRYNFRAHGTAINYFAGDTGIGVEPNARLDVTGESTPFGTAKNALRVTGLTSFSRNETVVGNNRPVAMAMAFIASPGSLIGSSTDWHGLDIVGSSTSSNMSSNSSLYPFESTALWGGTNTLGSMYGAYLQTNNNSTGTVNLAVGLRLWHQNNNNGTTNTYYGIQIQNPNKNVGGTINNIRGIYIANITNGTLSNWGIYNEATNNYIEGLLVGTTTNPNSRKLLVNGTTELSTLILGSGNAVTASVATPSTHKVQMTINGTTYFLLASNV